MRHASTRRPLPTLCTPVCERSCARTSCSSCRRRCTRSARLRVQQYAQHCDAVFRRAGAAFAPPARVVGCCRGACVQRARRGIRRPLAQRAVWSLCCGVGSTLPASLAARSCVDGERRRRSAGGAQGARPPRALAAPAALSACRAGCFASSWLGLAAQRNASPYLLLTRAAACSRHRRRRRSRASPLPTPSACGSRHRQRATCTSAALARRSSTGFMRASWAANSSSGCACDLPRQPHASGGR